VLVLGATGMLGNAMVRLLSDSPGLDVMASARHPGALLSRQPRWPSESSAASTSRSLTTLPRCLLVCAPRS
jgi:uncharacterized protein YbjT (DUF2867 family)